MKWIKEMREALQSLRYEAHPLAYLYGDEVAQAVLPSAVNGLRAALEKADKALAAIPDGSEASYEQARGIIPWQEGDELPEETIRRMRGGCEAEMLGVLRLVKRLENRAMKLFNLKKPASYFNVYDTLLYVSEYIEDELGYRLLEDVDNADNHN